MHFKLLRSATAPRNINITKTRESWESPPFRVVVGDTIPLDMIIVFVVLYDNNNVCEQLYCYYTVVHFLFTRVLNVIIIMRSRDRHNGQLTISNIINLWICYVISINVIFERLQIINNKTDQIAYFTRVHSIVYDRTRGRVFDYAAHTLVAVPECAINIIMKMHRLDCDFPCE